MKNPRCEASFTVEAAFVLSVIFFSLYGIICRAYRMYDTVSGAMILEETVERARHEREPEKKCPILAEEGRRTGNPRVYLGEFAVMLEPKKTSILGKAAAGDWNLEITMKRFLPEAFLRKTEAFWDMGESFYERDDGL